MQRLTGLDAGFLYMETPSSAMHVAGLAIFDPSTAPGGWTVEKYKELVRSRLHLAPPFRRRLVEVPFQLHHPLWIEDPDFDLDWHVRHIAVPAPGGRQELAELASHLVSLQLDRSRPLWEIWLIEGLDDGNIAILTKVHHAAIDGASGAELTVSLFDLTPEIAEAPAPEKPWVPDRLPTDPELVSYAAASLARQPLAAFKAVRRTASVALTLRRTNRQPGITPPPAPFSAPRTSINRPITPHRSYAMTTVPLQEVKAVKNAFGTTVNDVVLAVCGGALRRYFDAHDETPDGPLVAMVPVSVRSEEERSSMGNRVTPSLTSLATDIDDPVERLRTIHDAMQRTKEQTNAIGAETLTNWAEFAAPMLFSRATRLYSNMRMADRHRPLFNVTISNVPGPPFPLYVSGAKMVANYPVGPIFDGGGLNMTVMSYRDRMDFGLLACPDVVDDVWSIAAAVRDALDELIGAVPSADPAEPPDALGDRDVPAVVGDRTGAGTTAPAHEPAMPPDALDDELDDAAVGADRTVGPTTPPAHEPAMPPDALDDAAVAADGTGASAGANGAPGSPDEAVAAEASVRHVATAGGPPAPDATPPDEARAKESAGKKASAQQLPTNEPGATKAVAETTPAKRAADKAPAKTTAAKQAQPGDATAAQAPAKKAPAKTTATKKAATKKAPAKKTAAAKKAQPQTGEATATQAAAKKAPTKKAPAKTTATKKAPAKKTAAKKAQPRTGDATAVKAPARKESAEKAPAKKSAAKAAGGPAAKPTARASDGATPAERAPGKTTTGGAERSATSARKAEASSMASNVERISAKKAASRSAAKRAAEPR